MNQLIENKKYSNRAFEDIKHIDENGNEYWLARELQKVLEYKEWRFFQKVIEKAKYSCLMSNNDVNNHFGVYSKMVVTGDSKRKIEDYNLTRYACYLIVQNGNSKNRIIALGQTYFAIQTRKQELLNEVEYESLSEDGKRFYNRNITKKRNYSLNLVAKNVGVKNFDKFTNAGYRGLYNGETANDIAKRKGLRYREDILDNMGSEELGANIFRITQTEAVLKMQKLKSEIVATNSHYKIGKNVRDSIIKNGTTLPELLPTPDKSLKELEKENKQI
jgi:DNA-damage-inducible protein D